MSNTWEGKIMVVTEGRQTEYGIIRGRCTDVSCPPLYPPRITLIGEGGTALRLVVEDDVADEVRPLVGTLIALDGKITSDASTGRPLKLTAVDVIQKGGGDRARLVRVRGDGGWMIGSRVRLRRRARAS